MKTPVIVLTVFLVLIVSALDAAWNGDRLAPPVAVWSPTATPTAFGGLPGRATPTASARTATPTPTPAVTSPFVFPTTPPDLSPTPSQDCTDVFPLENVESIDFGTTSLAQLEAAFGHAAHVSGRANRFRFEEDGCALIVLIGVDEALEAELTPYGTLDLLLERYGPPDVAGESQGNLTLLDIGHAVLFYPELGAIALFDVAPDELTRDTPVVRLIFRPPYEADQQLRRLNVSPITDWQPPLR